MAKNVVELGLFHGDGRAASQVGVLSALLDQLLNSLGEAALDAGELNAGTFRAELQAFRKALASDPPPKALGAAATKCLQVCHEYFARFQAYLAERDVEFGETIDVLRAALAKVTGDAEGVNAALDENSRKFKRLTAVDNIRLLRRQLSRAVVDLETVVAEKKRQEKAQHAKLANQIAELESRVEASMAEALKDELTSVANRRGFDQTIKRWVTNATATKQPFVLAMVDLDDFKRINDEHGHSVGDRILQVAARSLKNGIRATDYIARYGGEEFVVLLRGIGDTFGQQRMEEILSKIAAARYEYHGVGREVVVSFTASCGVTEFVPGESYDALIKRADDALYEAKGIGKARVVTRNATAPDAKIAAS